MSDHPEWFLDFCRSVTAKRPRTVIDHILEHGCITTEELKDKYGYHHPPRAARDVRELGIPLETFRIIASNGRKIGAYRFGNLAELGEKHAPNSPIPPSLPDPLPSPISFEIRDGVVHKALPPAPTPPDERRAGAESAWMALKQLLADLAESSAGQNRPRIGRMLDRCRAALGYEFQQMDVVMLGVHASRVDQMARRPDEILMPEDAANLVAFNAQLGLFLGQFPEWSEYARGIADRFGSDEAEQKAVSDASDAVQAMRNKAPDLLAPDAVDALTALEEDATPETDADGQGAFTPPINRRSILRAVRDLFLKLYNVVITPARKGMEKGIERHVESMTAGALSAASTSLLALAKGLPAEFGLLRGIVTYLARILGPLSNGRTKNINDDI